MDAEAFKVIAGFVIANLPDSMSERRALLGALMRVQLPNKRATPIVFSKKILLERHLQLQKAVSGQGTQAARANGGGE